jgi:hypothetical protein
MRFHTLRRAAVPSAALTLLLSLVGAGSAGATASATSSLAFGSVKEMNYMPVADGWSAMWTNWDSSTIAANYAQIAALGANTVRIIVPPFTMGYPTPTDLMASHLAQAISLAAAAGLHVQLTLFDQFGNYDQIVQSEAFVYNLLHVYANDPQIVFVEVQNEIDPTNAGAMAWAKALIRYTQSVVGSIPVTISTPGATGIAGLERLKTALGAVTPDLYDFHYYLSPGDAATVLSQAKQLAAPEPLFVGETGYATTPSASGAPSPAILSAQAEYLYSIEGATAALGLAAAAPWTLNDFLPTAIPTSLSATQRYFGLYTTTGTAKPAASVVSSFFNAGTEGTIDNPSFEASPNGYPTGWGEAYAANGNFAVDSTTAHSGADSVTLSGTTGTLTSEPAWTTVVNSGVLATGEHLQATVWAKGLSATGQNRLTLSWFDINNHYLGNAVSRPLPDGTSNWTELGVDGTAPAGAAYAQLYLQSYDNSGTVWFDDAGVSVLGSAAFPPLPPVPVTSGVGPTVSNPSFETVSNGLPASWSEAYSANGSFGVDGTTSHTGTESVRLSQASGTLSTQPAWTTLINTGALSDGEHLQATVSAKGLNTTGVSGLSVSWFDASKHYLGDAVSSPLPSGTSNWTELGVDATAPNGAAYAELNLQSYQNSGTVWFDDANVSVLGMATFPALPPVPVTSGVGPAIANPGFESVTNGIPTGWSKTDSGNGAFSVDGTVAHSGSNSVDISHSAADIGAQAAWTTLANTGALTAGEQLSVSVWARGSESTGQNRVALAWFNAQHTYLGGSLSTGLLPGSTSWTLLTATGSAPAGAAYALVSLQSYNNSGTVWFDDASLTGLPTAAPTAALTVAPTDLVPNSGFETLNGAAPLGWTPRNGPNGHLAVATGGHQGSYSVTISSTSGPAYAQPAWTATLETHGLTPGQTYSADVWATGTAATGESAIAIAWFTAKGGYISNSVGTPLPVGSTPWLRLSVSSTVPANAAYGEVSLQSYDNHGTVAFDDVGATLAP